MIHQFYSQLKILIIIVVILSIYGCSHFGITKPNVPFTGPYPNIYYQIENMNPLLATEIRKLPEFQDGISTVETIAIERLCDLYLENSKEFDIAFEKIYQIGIPEVRRYCTPLQALYWLLEDDKIDNIDLAEFDLKKLLNEAWFKSGFEYADTRGRWQDYNEVIDRLNSPELVSFYMRFDFYRCSRAINKMQCPRQTPYFLFRSKKGNCEDFSDFAVLCLTRSGYNARKIKVIGRKRHGAIHTACEFIHKNENYYIIDLFTGSSGVYTKEAYTKSFKIK